MARNSSGSSARIRDPKFAVRVILGVLLAANLIAAGFLRFPPGGSAEDLTRQMASLQRQVANNRTALEQTRQHALAVQEGRDEGDKFVQQYFLPLRTASGTLSSELQRAAAAAKIKPKSTSFAFQPIEGSDSLQTVGITATYEGLYPDVLKFVHSIDQSPLLLIVESLSAVPQQDSKVLEVSMKMDAFVRAEDGE
jgi:Tfp pilus assembly protein PilO